MKREPYSANTTPSNDPPKGRLEDAWLDDDDWGGNASDPFSPKQPNYKKKQSDPFANMDLDDPFAKPQSNTPSSPNNLHQKHQIEQRRARAIEQRKRQEENQKREVLEQKNE